VEAIALHEAKLKEAHGVESALADMAVAISGKKAALRALDADLAARKADADAELGQAMKAAKADLEAQPGGIKTIQECVAFMDSDLVVKFAEGVEEGKSRPARNTASRRPWPRRTTPMKS